MKYFATTNLKHDGREYMRGDEIEIDERDRASSDLQSMGAIQTEPIGEAPTPAPAPAAQPAAANTGMRALSPDVRAGSEMAPTAGSETAAEPSEDMKRDDLEAMAVAEGIAENDAQDAPNKAALIKLIEEHRASTKGETFGNEPEHDPSVNL